MLRRLSQKMPILQWSLDPYRQNSERQLFHVNGLLAQIVIQGKVWNILLLTTQFQSQILDRPYQLSSFLNPLFHNIDIL